MSESSYKLIPAALLFKGMVAPHDIYDHSSDSLLIAENSVIDDAMIERIQVLNKYESMIYVTAETEQIMRMQGLSSDILVSLEALEEQTGYDKAKGEALDMLEKIIHTGATAVDQKELNSLAQKISAIVANTKPAVILDLVNALAPVDEYLPRHCLNVSLLNALFGKWLHLPPEAVEALILVGLLHDCGKACLPQQIISAPRSLTGIEFEVIKTHSARSYDLLSEFPELLRRAVRGHHEKMNGSGYPDALIGDSIPYMSRITAISDIYDAMTAKRVYKEPQSPFAILSMINELRGKELDPSLVDIFMSKMAEELLGKPVLLSNGAVGIVQACDIKDIKHPQVRLGSGVVKTSPDLYCCQMFFEGDDVLH